MKIHKVLYDKEKLFRDFFESHNHPLDDNINYDTGTFHCFKCPNGCATDARYKFFANGAAYLKCWKCHIEAKFNANNPCFDNAEKSQLSIDAIEGYEQEAKQRYAQNAITAKHIFSIADEIKASSHFYLQKKHANCYGLRVLTIENEITKNACCYRGTLLIPCYNNSNDLVNLERIYFSKKENKFQKRPLVGAQRTGAFYLIGKIINANDAILIAEGYSTAATIYEAIGYPVVVSFNCGNIPHVAKLIRDRYPQSKIIIACDIDSNDAGEMYAKKAIELVGGKYVKPDFSVIPNKLKPDTPRSDFNDLFVLLMANGFSRTAALTTVRQQIQKI